MTVPNSNYKKEKQMVKIICEKCNIVRPILYKVKNLNVCGNCREDMYPSNIHFLGTDCQSLEKRFRNSNEE
jgi:hypothetical protein